MKTLSIPLICLITVLYEQQALLEITFCVGPILLVENVCDLLLDKSQSSNLPTVYVGRDLKFIYLTPFFFAALI